jgi:putative mRNA 3-end processing factor
MTRKTRDPRAMVAWRGGVHLVGTPLWFDAQRTREACFVSSALVPHAGRHRQIIATRETLELLPPPRRRGRVAARALAVPFGRPFTLGELRLELFPSGVAPGAASLLVDAGGRRVVYASAVQPRAGRLVAPAEVRAADVLVLDASLGRQRFRPDAEVLADLAAWVGAALAEGGAPIVLVPPLALGAEVARTLGAAHPLRAHPILVALARRLRALGVEMPVLGAGPPTPGEVLLWPLSGRDAPALAALPRARTAWVSGAEPPRGRVDAVFALPEQAGADELDAYVRATGAAVVYLLGAGAAELGRRLSERGVVTRRLGPPEQLRLPSL